MVAGKKMVATSTRKLVPLVYFFWSNNLLKPTKAIKKIKLLKKWIDIFNSSFVDKVGFTTLNNKVNIYDKK